MEELVLNDNVWEDFWLGNGENDADDDVFSEFWMNDGFWEDMWLQMAERNDLVINIYWIEWVNGLEDSDVVEDYLQL